MSADHLTPPLPSTRRVVPVDRAWEAEPEDFHDTQPSVVWHDDEVLGDEAAWVDPAVATLQE
jgi:hypothetical protein